MEKGYLVKITAYHLIYTAYHEAGTGYKHLCNFIFIFLFIFQLITAGYFYGGNPLPRDLQQPS